MRKMMQWVLAAILICGLGVFTSCTNSDNPQPEPQTDLANYTLVIYGNVGGRMDNLIEGIWAETQQLLTDKRVRVFCVHKYGKEEGFVGKYGMPGEVVAFELDKDTKFEEISGQGTVGKDLPLYEPTSLTRVLNWAKEVAPAKEYVLTLFGHGGGFDAAVDYPKSLDEIRPLSRTTRGVLYDEWFEGRIGMDMYELTEAIEASDIKHLKAIMFHNCLMGDIQSLTEVQSYADYIFATPFLMTSEDNPMIPCLVKNMRATTDFEQAARQTIIDSKDRMINGFKHEDPADMNGNMELLKSAELPVIRTATKKLAARICELYTTQREAIDKATNKAYRFFSRRPYFDLLDYTQALAEETGDEQLNTIAEELEQAFGKAILQQVTADMGIRPALKSYSLSVVLLDHDTYNLQVPNTQHTYRQAYEYSDFHVETQWGQWLEMNQQLPTGNPCGQKY
ncbi:MAG: hypothetical protein II450_06980 [Prevotella sp.]|nr:hypothetical protein [Prevotella sp.]